MSLSQVFGKRWTGGAAPAVSVSPEITGTISINADFSLAGAVTDQQEQFGFDKDTIKGLLISVDGNDTAVVTMETNATDHSGGQIFTFPIGGGEMVWDNRSPLSNPVSADVTTTYWTHSGSETVTVKVRVLT